MCLTHDIVYNLSLSLSLSLSLPLLPLSSPSLPSSYLPPSLSLFLSQGTYSKYRYNQVDPNPLLAVVASRKRSKVGTPSLEDDKENLELNQKSKRRKAADEAFGTNPLPKLEKFTIQVGYTLHRYLSSSYIQYVALTITICTHARMRAHTHTHTHTHTAPIQAPFRQQ